MFRAVGTAGGLHGEVRIGDSMLMMGGGIPGREFRATANTHALHLYVPDCDAVYERALRAGATSIGEPRDQEYGERSGERARSGGELLVYRYAPRRELHSEGTEQRQRVHASAAGGAGDQLLEAGLRGAGDWEIRIARRRGSSRGDTRRRLGGGDGRGPREVSAHADDVLSVRARLRCGLSARAAGGRDFDCGTSRPSLRRPQRRSKGCLWQSVVHCDAH